MQVRGTWAGGQTRHMKKRKQRLFENGGRPSIEWNTFDGNGIVTDTS